MAARQCVQRRAGGFARVTTPTDRGRLVRALRISGFRHLCTIVIHDLRPSFSRFLSSHRIHAVALIKTKAKKGFSATKRSVKKGVLHVGALRGHGNAEGVLSDKRQIHTSKSVRSLAWHQ